MKTSSSNTSKSRRINLRASARQETLIRTGAATAGVSVTDFILDSACLQAEHALANRRDFEVSATLWQSFLEALDRPARIKPELANLFSDEGASGSGHSK